MILARAIIGADGTPSLGTLVSRDGAFTCATLERSGNGDHPCIPAGEYTVHLATHHPGTPHAYPCPELDTDAIDRTHIQIHIANDVAELLGCIAPGERVSEGGQSIDDSHVAFGRLMQYLDGAFPFTLTITDPQPQ